jgi:uncharacterized protein with PIN domain
MQLGTSQPLKETVAAPPPCDDCRMPVVFRTEVPDLVRARQVRVYQCVNCAKVIWGD